MSMLDMTAGTQTGQDIDHVAMQKGTANLLTHLDSKTTIGTGDHDIEQRDVMVAPSWPLPTPMAACYTGPCPADVPRWSSRRP